MANGRGRRRLSLRPPVPLSEPDISAVHKAVIERALRWAWSEICVRWPQVVRSGREEAISDRLAEILNEQHARDHRRRAPGLSSFETVVRGGKVRNRLGRIEKAPDLVFRPPTRGVRIRDDWGFFVECKIINGNQSIGRYCSQGVARFCLGEYAYRMPSGGMLAFVRDSSRPFVSLQAHLTAKYRTQSHTARTTLDMSDSIHTRRGLPKPCVDITLVHLWLDVPTA